MADEFKYDLKFTTSADLVAAEKAKKSLEEVGEVQKRFLSASEAEAQRVQILVDRAKQETEAKRQAAAATEALAVKTDHLGDLMARTADTTKLSYGNFYDLDAEMRKVNKTQDSFTAGTTRMAPATRNSSQALLLFSQGFEDAQYGIRGVLNNIPGLVVALGGTAGLAGALSIAAVGFSVVYDWFKKTGDEAKKLVVDIDDVAGKMGELKEEDLTKARDELQQSRAAADSARVKIGETLKAQDDYAIASLDNAAKIAEAEKIINELLGVRANKLKELKEQAEADAARRAEETRQQIAREQRRLAEAAETLNDRGTDFSSQARLTEETVKDRDATIAKLEALRQQKKELEEILKLPTTRISAAAGSGFAPAEIPENVRQITDAKERLASPAFNAELKGLQVQLDKLDRQLVEDAKSLQGAKNQVIAAEKNFSDVSGGVSKTIERLQETLAKSNVLAQAQNAQATAEEVNRLSTENSNRVGEITSALTQQAESAKTAIEQAILREGPKAAVAAKDAAIGTLAKLLEDGFIAPEEVNQMRAAIEQGRLGMMSLNSDTSQALGLMVSNTDSLRALMLGSIEDSKRIYNQLEALRVEQVKQSGLIQTLSRRRQ